MTVDTTAAPATTMSGRVGLAMFALAMGGFAIGTTEFVTMGLLKDIAAAIDRDEATTGHIISAYAAGVVVGAPLIIMFGARLPRRALAIGLVAALGLGNALTAIAPGYTTMMLARFVAGLPHGAYFGVASLLAAAMVTPAMRGRAVSMVMLGLSVATVAGVPASAWLGQQWGWRVSYWMVVAITVVTIVGIFAWVRDVPGDPSASPRHELAALKRPQVIVAFLTGTVGFGGLFAVYSYVSLFVTDAAGMGESVIPLVLLSYGIGSVLGTLLAGVLADWNNIVQIMAGFFALVIASVVLAVAAGAPAVLFGGFLVIGALGSILAIGLQIRLMSSAEDAEMLGAALNHASLNIANGAGAWLGGLVLIHGVEATALVGAGLAAGGLVIFVLGRPWRTAAQTN